MSNDLSNCLTHGLQNPHEPCAAATDRSNAALDLRTRTQRTADIAAPVAEAGATHPKTLANLRRASQPLPAETVLMTASAVARALSVSKITVWRWTQAGHLRALKLGDGAARAPIRYRAIDIARFVEERLGAGE